MIQKFIAGFSVLLTVLYASCDTSHKTENIRKQSKSVHDESASIYTKKEGILIVLMDNSLSSYFIFQGQPMGFEYEMLEMFAKENDLVLKVKIIDDVEHILDSLVAGHGDLVAANLSISQERLEKVAFTTPLLRTKQVLVQRLPDDRQSMTKEQIENSLIRDRLDLENKEITVRKNSSFELMLTNLIAETGIDLSIKYAPGDVVTEQLIEMVSNKEIDYTISDLNKAEIFNAYYDNIDINTPMSLSQPIAWALNKNATGLLSKLNSWIENRKGSLEFNMIYNRYFEMTKRKERRISREYQDVKDGVISGYDNMIKKYANELNWDWRLLAALIYKESMFNPKTKSWRGAVGLMQLMPQTAKSYGVQPSELQNPDKNLTAGTRHLEMLENHWKEELNDSLEIIKFTLGSYNVGLGHVEDAIRLTEKYQLDPKKWDDHVAKMLLNKSIPKYYKDEVVQYGYCRGKEPVNYVETILQDYQLYAQFTN